MKKIIFTLLVILFGLNLVKGQVWVQPGAVWHYDYWLPLNGFDKMEYEKDTLIQGRICQKITTMDYWFVKNHLGQTVLIGPSKLKDQFTSVSGDTVFWWNNNNFFVLYNFGASIGDNWVVSVVNPGGTYAECDDTSRIFVTDTGSVVINSVRYRTITLEPSSNSAIGFRGKYVERFGLMSTVYDQFQTLFPDRYQCDSITAVVDWAFFRFKCFQDSTFPLYNPHTQDCEHLLKTIGIDEPEAEPVSIFPNPTSGDIFIYDKIKREKIADVYSYQGVLIQRFYLSKEDSRINLSEFPAGVYFILVNCNQGQSQSFKIIKE